MRSFVLFALTLAATVAVTSDASACGKRRAKKHCNTCSTAVVAAPAGPSCCGGGGGYPAGYGGYQGGYGGGYQGGYGGGYHGPVYGGGYGTPQLMPQPGVGGTVVVPGPMPGK